MSNFALPAGTAAGLGVLSSYFLAFQVLDLSVRESRTVATTALVAIGLYLVLVLEASGRRRGTAVLGLCIGLAAGYMAVLVVPWARDFFALAAPDPAIVAPALVGAGLAIAGLWLTDERFAPGRAYGAV